MTKNVNANQCNQSIFTERVTEADTTQLPGLAAHIQLIVSSFNERAFEMLIQD